MSRTKTAVPFGGGLDRNSGVMAVEPATFADLRNVHLHAGRAELRRGLLLKLALSGVTDVLAIHPVRATGIGAVVTFASSTGTVSLWITTGDAATTAKIGDLPWTISAGAVSPPRVMCADSYDKLFIAHDEPNFDLRNVTSIYDINTGDLNNLFTTTLSAPKFRGVATYLAYLIAWGVGTPDDPNRPEIVRTSMPADPTTFDLNHYWVAGQRGDAVLNCVPAGDILMVQKSAQTYDIFGYDRTTFGIRPGDRLFGVGGSRLSVTVGGVNYRWTLDGPRRSGGGASDDLSLPLDLAGPAADALANNLDLDNGFACYLPARREVLFVFGQWAYVLHLANPAALQWSFRQFAVTPFCGGILYDGGTGLGPVAHAELVVASSATEDTLQQDATIVGSLLGGEQLEWWVKPYTTNVWAVNRSQAVAGASTVHGVLSNLLHGIPYDVAARVKRNGVAASAYGSSNPTLWPSTALLAGLANTVMGDVTAASFVSADDGLGHQVVTITLGDTAFGHVCKQSHVIYEIQIDRGGGAGWVTPANPVLTDFFNGKASSDFSADLGHTYNMRVRQRSSFGTAFPYASAWSAALAVTI